MANDDISTKADLAKSFYETEMWSPDAHKNAWLRVLKVWCSLAPREKAVLATIAERLLVGQQLHGLLYKGKKKWLKETKEEAMDGLVYIAASLEDEKEE